MNREDELRHYLMIPVQEPNKIKFKPWREEFKWVPENVRRVYKIGPGKLKGLWGITYFGEIQKMFPFETKDFRAFSDNTIIKLLNSEELIPHYKGSMEQFHLKAVCNYSNPSIGEMIKAQENYVPPLQLKREVDNEQGL